MYNVINVVYTTRKLSADELINQKQYAFLYNGNVKIGDLLVSPTYSTPLQVTNVYKSNTNMVKGVPLKYLIVDLINGKETNFKDNMKETNSMFGGMVDKYKSQFIPQRENNVKLSIQGTIVVPVNGEYVGMDAEGNLISYDASMCVDVPVYSVNTPTEKVNVGDIVKNGNSYGKVLAKNSDGTLKVLSFSGYTHNKKEIKDALLGQSMTRVLVNMFNFSANNTGFNPIMFAMAEGDKFDVKSLVMLSMMPEGKNLFNGINPMMLMMLDNSGDSSNMMSMMLFSQMMQGGKNPFTPQPQLVPQPQEDVVPTKFTIDEILGNPDLVEKLKALLK